MAVQMACCMRSAVPTPRPTLQLRASSFPGTTLILQNANSTKRSALGVGLLSVSRARAVPIRRRLDHSLGRETCTIPSGKGAESSNQPRLSTQRTTSHLSRRLVPRASGKVGGPRDPPEVEEKGEESILAAVALITGTTVGAGILALPATASPAGFIPSSCVLLACWAFLTLQAFLLAEVNVSMAETIAPPAEPSADRAAEVVSLRTMAEITLGPLGGAAATAVYLFLSYTLMVAYISKGSEILEASAHLPPPVSAAAFSLGIGGLLFWGSARDVDALNQFLTVGLLVMFAVIVAGGATLADWDELARCDWQSTPHVVPIVFLSLVYHDLVPVVCSSLGQNRVKIRTSLLVGSLIPVLMLLAWDAVALCMCQVAGAQDPLQMLMITGGPVLTAVMASFSLLAVSTSFIGSVVGLTAFASEQISLLPPSLTRTFPETSQPHQQQQRPPLVQPIPVSTVSTVHSLQNEQLSESVSRNATLPLHWKEEGPPAPKDSLVGVWSQDGYQEGVGSGAGAGAGGGGWVVGRKAASYLLVLVPPLACALATPDAFLWASEVAGAYGMTALYGLLPPLMAASLRRSQQPGEKGHPLRVPGGNWALAGMEVCAVAIIATQALSDTFKLPSIQNALLDKSSSTDLVMVADFKPPSLNNQESDSFLSL